MFMSRMLKDKRLVAVAGSTIITLYAAKNNISHAETVSSSFSSGVSVGIKVSDYSDFLDDEAKWEYKRKSCSVCKMFLESPCKSSFKTWTSCSDNAKAAGMDPNSVCSQLSQDLLACTNTNDSFFRAQANDAAVMRKQQMEARRSKYRMSLSTSEQVILQPNVL